jgi:hypothetical protein
MTFDSGIDFWIADFFYQAGFSLLHLQSIHSFVQFMPITGSELQFVSTNPRCTRTRNQKEEVATKFKFI